MGPGIVPGLLHERTCHLYTIGQIGKRFGVSRTTLLYYDSIGLLSPSARSASNYRLYTENEVQRMEQIKAFRDTGLPLESIGELLKSEPRSAPTAILARHLQSVNQEIARLRKQEQIVIKLLGNDQAFVDGRNMTKERWVSILSATGLDEAGMRKWHEEFERSAPGAHQDFLESLGIEQDEIARIRQHSRDENRKTEL